ncbi:MAG: fumarylacetoacetate hydrolase family protein [Candidatus Rokubacteria bacterium]|nr:fumarylacetoacetate hydrolase family protein [Candidatus Rokubacteria bacterium]
MTAVPDPMIDRFIANRDSRGQIAPPSETRALSAVEAYGIQDRLREALVTRGARVIGWKAGFTNKATQTAFGATEPVSGFLLAEGVFPSGGDVPMARFAQLAVEAEVAFVMREDLAGPGITAPRALAAVEGALPALELIDQRFTGKATATDVIADGVYANAIVLGAPISPVKHLDLALEGLVYELNGAIAATNTAAEVMGSPANSLAWIANQLGARGLGLRAGDLVMSGSVSILLRPKAGDTVRATYTRLGSVAARFV